MFKKRSKKGLSHVDWAMSLAIFLLYLAWFFIFVKPLFGPAQNMDVLLNILQDGLEKEVFQDVSRIKIFVPGSIRNDYEPIVIPFDRSWQAAQMSHSADYFELDSDKMFFLANLSNSTMFSIYYPHKALQTRPVWPITADEERVSSGMFSAYFTDHMLDRVFFDGEERLSGFSIEVDGTELDDSGSFFNSTFLAKYQRSGDDVNLTSYLFTDNSRIYTYIIPSDRRNHSVVVEFAAYNYTDFYIDPVSNGDIEYGIGPNCRYYTTGFLDLYGPSSGLLVTFSRNISMRLCANETSPTVRLEFDSYVGEEDNFNIIFHSGSLNEVKEYPLRPVVGVTEIMRTLSAKQVSLLKNRDYDYMKQLFNYPKDRQFNVTVSSDVVAADYGIPLPDVEDVYARKIEGVILDDAYRPRRALITMTVW
jgi:hypothetical protein